MRRFLSIRGAILLAAGAVLGAVAGAYAASVTFDRTVTARWTVLVTGDIAIEVYEEDGTTRLTDIDFGVSLVDLLGNLETPVHKVVVENLSSGDVQVSTVGTTTLAEAVLLAGDADVDNDVDVADLRFVGAALNQSAPFGVTSDINRDGLYDVEDIALVGLNIGKTRPILWPHGAP